jgi:plasmid maintenance system antidote protein VapI
MAETNYAVAPGEYITEWLEENEMDTSTLARRLGVPDKYVPQLLAGHMALFEPMLVKLADLTGIPVDWWKRLDTQYWKDKARLEGQ